MRWFSKLLGLALSLGIAAASAQTLGPPGGGGGGSPTGAAGGDLGGTYPNPTVTSGSHITNASIPNSGLVNSGVTVNGISTALGGSYNQAGLSGSPNNPAAITSNTQKMLGLSNSPTATFTSTASGTVLLFVLGQWNNNTIAGTCTYNLRFGTGVAPANNAAASGTALNTFIYTAATALETVPITDTAITALTPGTAYWVDLSVASSGVSTCTLTTPSIIVWEK